MITTYNKRTWTRNISALVKWTNNHTTNCREENEAKKISYTIMLASRHTTQHEEEEEAKKISVTPGYAGKPLYDPAPEGRRSQKDIILGL